MHQVAVLALHDFVPFDLGIACEVFGRVSLPSGDAGIQRARSVRVRLAPSAHALLTCAFLTASTALHAPTLSSFQVSRMRR